MGRPGDGLRRIAERAANRGGRASAAAMGEAGEEEMKRLLSLRSHAKGTPTPSPAGQPPAKISGRLGRSVIADRPARVGAFRWRTRVGPRNVPYARIQDKGGVAGNGAVLPPRPYAEPTAQALRASGVLSARSARAFSREVFGV
jgi:hypothetical protein